MTARGKWAAETLGVVLLGFLMLAATAWGVLALLYWDHADPLLRRFLATAYGAGSLLFLVGFMRSRWRGRAFGAFAGLLTLLLAAWFSIAPSNDRDWQPENAILAYASITGTRITMHNIRNFDYRTETDFTRAYYDRTFDLEQLNAVDLFAVYWMGPAIAHVFVSFGFTDGSHVAMSIEARRERGEGYSTVRGFFRQYELYYAVGDERDLVRLRTNYRHTPPEQVYLYRLRGSRENGQRLFLEYVHEINALKERPEWYNALTSNCTSNIWLHSRVNPGHLSYSWKILLSGYLPELLYEHGKLDGSVPFTTLQRRAHVNARAQAADQARDFSERIRATEPPP
jgi:hypothetical protein